MNTMHLIGAEDVSRAASSMASAAQTMREAAAAMEHSLYMHRMWMDEWLMRYQAITEAAGCTDGCDCSNETRRT